MEQSAESSKHELESMEQKGSKRAYVAPSLVEYGSFAKLTQGGSAVGGDMNLNSPACL